jgi:hypothetical protein
MQTFFAMLLSLRVGFAPSPADTAVLSIRQQTLAAAETVASRDVFVGPELARAPRFGSALTRQQPQSWGMPATVRIIEKDDWRDILVDTLNGNAKLANAVMWVASAPVRLRVSGDRMFVAVSVRIP